MSKNNPSVLTPSTFVRISPDRVTIGEHGVVLQRGRQCWQFRPASDWEKLEAFARSRGAAVKVQGKLVAALAEQESAPIRPATLSASPDLAAAIYADENGLGPNLTAFVVAKSRMTHGGSWDDFMDATRALKAAFNAGEDPCSEVHVVTYEDAHLCQTVLYGASSAVDQYAAEAIASIDAEAEATGLQMNGLTVLVYDYLKS